MAEAATKTCIYCGKEKPLSEFGYSAKKRHHTKTCIACWVIPERGKLVPNLVTLYAELLPLMDNIRKATFEQLVKEEWDEQAMRLIMQGLVTRASQGDARAAELILNVRLKLRAEGDGSEEDVLNLAQLLATDPLQVNKDTA
jgi:hypothetical protein